MIDSLILRTATRLLVPLLLLFSVFLLLRGHHAPGGGFIGGLVAASAFALYAIAYGTREARRSLRVPPRDLIGTGLALALASGLLPLVLGRSLLTGTWTTLHLLGLAVELGTPLFFDIGVYLVVMGITITILFALEERGLRLFPDQDGGAA